MKTTAAISIATESAALTKYFHCASRADAEHLASEITALEESGFTVEAATSGRASVPNSYRGAYKIHAPYYVYSPLTREITLVNGKLENRTKGASIPANFCISGDTVPQGFRCFKRGEGLMLIRRA